MRCIIYFPFYTLRSFYDTAHLYHERHDLITRNKVINCPNYRSKYKNWTTGPQIENHTKKISTENSENGNKRKLDFSRLKYLGVITCRRFQGLVVRQRTHEQVKKNIVGQFLILTTRWRWRLGANCWWRDTVWRRVTAEWRGLPRPNCSPHWCSRSWNGAGAASPSRGIKRAVAGIVVFATCVTRVSIFWECAL